jgi:hypothetical protein
MTVVPARLRLATAWQPSPAPTSRAKAGGSPRCCPVLCGLRDRCIAAMLATRTRREGGVEPPPPGLCGPGGHRSSRREKLGRDAFHRVPNFLKKLGRCGNRPYQKWTGMRVARPLLQFGRPACICEHLCPDGWLAAPKPWRRRESRAGVAPASAVLQTAA